MAPGDRLPTERELARATAAASSPSAARWASWSARGAWSAPEAAAPPSSRPRIDRDLSDALSFTEEMLRRGLDPQTRLVGARPESAGEAVAAALGLEPGSPTLYLERLRLADGEPILLEQVHLPAERFPGLLASDLEHGSLYDLLTERYGARVARARETLEPVLLRAREARLLTAAAALAGAAHRGHRFAADGRPVEFEPDVRARRPHPLLRGAGRGATAWEGPDAAPRSGGPRRHRSPAPVTR